MNPAAALKKQLQSSLQSDSAQSLLKIIQDPNFREFEAIKTMKDEAGNRFDNAMAKANTELAFATLAFQSDIENNVDPSEVPFGEIFQNIDERSERLFVPHGDFVTMTEEKVDTLPSKVTSEKKKIADMIGELLTMLRAMNLRFETVWAEHFLWKSIDFWILIRTCSQVAVY